MPPQKPVDGGTVVHIDGLTIAVRSRAGIESCCYVTGSIHGRSVSIAFDMGVCFGSAAQMKHVFITHGHIDHIGALPSHAARRTLVQQPEALYHVPESIVARVKSLIENFEQLQEDQFRYVLIPVTVGTKHEICTGLCAEAFETYHRVDSVGYKLISTKRKLKRQYHDCDVRKLQREGTQVYDWIETLFLVYTGDTTIKVFEQHPELFEARVLIMEVRLTVVKLMMEKVTFLDNKVSLARAHETGHIHLDEVRCNGFDV